MTSSPEENAVKRWKRLALPILSAAAMSIGLGGQPGNTSPMIAAMADVLPADATAVFWVNTTAQAWSELDRFGLFPENALRPKSLKWILGFDYEAEIQPWLGNQVAIVLLPEITTVPLPQADPDSPTPSTDQPPQPKETLKIDLGVVVVMPTTDDEIANAFVDRLKAQALAGEPVRETVYKGITLLEWQTMPLSRETNSLEGAPKDLPTSPRSGLNFSLFLEAAPAPMASPSPAVESPAAPEPVAEPDAPNSDIPDPTQPTTADPASPEEAPTRFAIARFPGYVVAAKTARPLIELIDARVANETLSRRKAFEQTAQHPQAESALLTLYSDVPQLYQLVSAFNRKFLERFPDGPKYFTQPEVETYILDNYQSIQGLIWVESDGVRGQSSIYFTRPMPDGPKTPEDLPVYLNSSNALVDRLPINTYVAHNGRNFASFWQAAVNEIRRDPQNSENLDQLRREMQTRFGLDDRDIFSWMDGEYSIFFYPTKTGLFPTDLGKAWTLGLGVMVQTSDRPKAEAALLKLEQGLIKLSNGRLRLSARQVEDLEFRSLSNVRNAQLISILARSWAAEDTLIMTTGEGPLADLLPRPYQLLVDGFTFQEGIEPLPKNNSGYFYVNLSSSLSLIYQAIVIENLRRAEQYKRSQGQLYMEAMLRSQQAYYLEYGQFSRRIEDLGIGTGSETPQYRLRIVQRDRSRVYMVVQAKQVDLPSFSGTVAISRRNTTVIGMCETIQLTQTPPPAPQLRNTAKGTEVRCPAGSAIAGQINRPLAIPPGVAAVQSRLGVMRSLAMTTSLTPGQIQGDAFLRLATPQGDRPEPKN